MDKRGWIGVLAALVLISFSAGVRDPPITARLRILLAEEPKPGQAEGNRSPSRPGSPLGKPPNPPPASRAPFSPSPVLSPPSSNTPVSVPPSGTPSMPTKSSQNPLNHPPSPLPSTTPPKGKKNSPSAPENSPGKSLANYTCQHNGTGSTPTYCEAKGFVSCLQPLQNESQRWVLVVRNEGESTLNLTVLGPLSVTGEGGEQIPKNSSKKFIVDLPPGMTKDVNITVKGGNENCSLKLSPSPAAKAYSFPYVNRVTPVHGIYVASFTIIFIGGVWACRKLRNRGRAGGARVAYQQLEMSSERPPATLTNDDRVDGWDEHWSDDWDEEEALPRPSEGGGGGGRPVKSSSDRNEWEDWDD